MSERDERDASEKGYASDRLGRIAQTRLATLAEEAGLHIIAPQSDLDGWDFHISVPQAVPVDGGTFFDRDPPRVAMFAQLKSTTTKRRRVDISLQHWLHAATLQLPFFYIAMEFDAPFQLQRLHVIHVDMHLVEKVAERLRQLGAQRADAPQLQRHHLPLIWNSSHEVAATPEGLRNGLLAPVGSDMREYSARKRDWWENAGSATLRNHLRLRFNDGDAEADRRIAEWALGLTESLHVDELIRVEHRWDIAREFPPVPNASVSFGAPPTLGTTQVRVSTKQRTEHVEFSAEVFCNSVIAPHLPKSMWTIRVAGELVEMSFHAHSRDGTARVNVPSSLRPYQLRTLINTAVVFRLLSDECRVRFAIPGLDGEAYDAPLRQATSAPSRADGDLDIPRTFRGAESAGRIFSAFAISHDSMITAGELEDKSEELGEWRHLLDASQAEARVTMEAGKLIEAQRAGYLSCARLTLGDYELFAAILIVGSVCLSGSRACIAGAPSLVRRWAVLHTERVRWIHEELPDLLHELIGELEARQEFKLVLDCNVAEILRRRHTDAEPSA